VLLTRPPLPRLLKGVRLACVRHAASVYPEPGSNSPSSYISHHGSHRDAKCMLSCDPGQVTLLLLGLFAEKFSVPRCPAPGNEMIDRNCSLVFQTAAVLLSTLQLLKYPESEIYPLHSWLYRLPSKTAIETSDHFLKRGHVASGFMLFRGRNLREVLPTECFTRLYRRHRYYATGSQGCQ
jgi:hypothetical protein